MTAEESTFQKTAIPGASLNVLALRQELKDGRMKPVGKLELAGREITVAAGRDSLWAIFRDGTRLAVRSAYAPGGLKARRLRAKQGEALRVGLTSAIGKHVVTFSIVEEELPLIRVTTKLTPAEDLLVPFLPRDLYPLGSNDDPLDARGNIEAAQRGLNGGILYWRLDGEAPASFLYLQNLTALNDYFNATGTKPDGAVGGNGPSLATFRQHRHKAAPRQSSRFRRARK